MVHREPMEEHGRAFSLVGGPFVAAMLDNKRLLGRQNGTKTYWRPALREQGHW
jgi:hypothetical protein